MRRLRCPQVLKLVGARIWTLCDWTQNTHTLHVQLATRSYWPISQLKKLRPRAATWLTPAHWGCLIESEPGPTRWRWKWSGLSKSLDLKKSWRHHWISAKCEVGNSSHFLFKSQRVLFKYPHVCPARLAAGSALLPCPSLRHLLASHNPQLTTNGGDTEDDQDLVLILWLSKHWAQLQTREPLNKAGLCNLLSDIANQSQHSSYLKPRFPILWDLNKNWLAFTTSCFVEIQWCLQDFFKSNVLQSPDHFQLQLSTPSVSLLSFLCPPPLFAQCQSRQPCANLTFSVQLLLLKV